MESSSPPALSHTLQQAEPLPATWWDKTLSTRKYSARLTTKGCTQIKALHTIIHKAFKHAHAQDKNARYSCQGDAYEGNIINITHAWFEKS